MDISYTARLLYALFLDRSALSQKNGWTDNEGRVFIVYPITEIAEILDKGTTTIKSALNELDAAGLLERKREGFAAASRALGIKPYSTRTEDAFLENLNHALDNAFLDGSRCTVRRSNGWGCC